MISLSVKSKLEANAIMNILNLNRISDKKIEGSIDEVSITIGNLHWEGNVPYKGKSDISAKGYKSWNIKGKIQQ